jgi:hypothetical protein
VPSAGLTPPPSLCRYSGNSVERGDFVIRGRAFLLSGRSGERRRTALAIAHEFVNSFIARLF